MTIHLSGAIRSYPVRVGLTAVALFGGQVSISFGQHANVASTLHNLSVSGPGEVRSLTETEVCKFCHIPHNAVVAVPLWGHALSEVRKYRVPEIDVQGDRVEAPQPGGSSRLCLSCHDGTVALGDVGGPGDQIIGMTRGPRLTPDRPGFIGTDLSGSHPLSITVNETIDAPGDKDMGVKESSEIQFDHGLNVDSNLRMQCTTCHDPHSDQYFVSGEVPHFWVRPTVEEVCLACHELR